MEFMSLLTWFLSTAMGFGHDPFVAGGGPVAHGKTTTTATVGVRSDVAGGGPVSKKTST